MILGAGFACQPTSTEVKQNYSYPTRQDLDDERQAKKQIKQQKKINTSLKKVRNRQDSLTTAGYVGLWEYLNKFDRPNQSNRVAIYPLRAVTHKAPYGKYEDLDVYHYKVINGVKIEVITNKYRSAFTPQVNFISTYTPLLLDSTVRNQIKRVKKKDEYPYFAVLRINGKSFNLSDYLVPDTMTYFRYRERIYLVSAQVNNEAMGTTRQYSTLHIFDITDQKSINHFELKGRYQSPGLLYDYNGDGLLDYPVYETYLCNGFEPLLCEEKTSHEICGRIYLKSLNPTGWKKLDPYGIYFYLESPQNPYIYLKECNRHWVN
ncbi:hypothetical protein BKI52_22475 [marine bacterium AO1-C]|nr:hypothetical protein BKI52_22475 [marine bacterium AO1-C]